MGTYVGENAIDMEPVETGGNLAPLAALVLSELPNCSDLVVRQQLGFALREFCRETDACALRCAWNYADGEDLPDGRRAFRIVGVPSGMELLTVFEVKVNGLETQFDVLDGPVPKFVPDRWLCDSDKVSARYSACPKDGGEDCPKWFKEKYAEAITAGAMFHLLSMSNRVWSDPQRAAQYAAQYQEAIDDAAYRRMQQESQFLRGYNA